ncbi:hypothetical protein Tco_0535052 [Tanacetum coccineum]
MEAEECSNTITMYSDFESNIDIGDYREEWNINVSPFEEPLHIQVTSQVGEDVVDSNTTYHLKKKVSFIEDEKCVIEWYDETSLSTLTHIIVKEVHRKARVGVRELRHSLCHGKRKFQEVSNSTKLVNVTSKTPRENMSALHQTEEKGRKVCAFQSIDIFTCKRRWCFKSVNKWERDMDPKNAIISW